MKAITRIEQLLSGMELTPITRLETYIAYLNGQNVITPSPVTREEQILSGQHLTPATRKEMFMLYGMGNLDSVPVPITREEHFWYNWSSGDVEWEFIYYVFGTSKFVFGNGDKYGWKVRKESDFFKLGESKIGEVKLS